MYLHGVGKRDGENSHCNIGHGQVDEKCPQIPRRPEQKKKLWLYKVLFWTYRSFVRHWCRQWIILTSPYIFSDCYHIIHYKIYGNNIICRVVIGILVIWVNVNKMLAMTDIWSCLIMIRIWQCMILQKSGTSNRNSVVLTEKMSK